LDDIQNVKTTLAIVCSLLLAWTPVLAQATAAGVGRTAHTSCHCGKACCAAPSPESQPVPAAPVPSSSQNQLSPLAPAALVWILPTTLAPEFSPPFSSSLTAKGTPLYARNCAFLI
jgi:hypothetical protein